MPCYNTVPISIIPPTGQGQGPLVWQNGSQINRLNIPLNPSWLVFDGSVTRWGDGSAQAPIFLPSLQQLPSTSFNYIAAFDGSGKMGKFPVISYTTNQSWNFAGTGSQTVFTLTANTGPNLSSSYIISIDGVVQNYSSYTVSGTTLTFSQAPPNGTVVSVVSLGYAQTVNLADNSLVTATGSTTPRTLANRFSDVINVLDFGATGNGITDDTTAIQSACDFARTNGRSVKVPAGKYLISSSIFVESSFLGDGEKSTVFLLKTGTTFTTPAIIVSGIGYTQPASYFTFSSGYNGTYYQNSIGAILALQNANNRSCPWGVEISGFGITTQSGSRDSVQQNGLILQQIAHINISTISVTNLNGFGLVEDGLQDCTVSNINIENCGAGVNGSSQSLTTVAQFVIDQFWSAGGFNSTARVTHTYVQSEVSVWRNLQVGNIGTSGSGRGGSTENTFVGMHIEQNTSNSYDNSYIGGLLDTWLGGSISNTTVTINGGRLKFIGVDAETSWVVNPSDIESILISNCNGFNVTHLKGNLYIDNCYGAYTSIQYSGNGSFFASNCTFSNFIHGNNWEVNISNCNITFGTIGGNMSNFRMDGGFVIAVGSASPTVPEGIFTGVTFPNLYLSYDLATFNSCNFQSVAFNSVSYNPKFLGCIFNSTIDNGSGGQAYTAAEFYNCRFFNNVYVSNGASKVFNSVIQSGYTISAAIKVNNYNTAGSAA